VILKRYGANVQTVKPNFDARAMNEIGFQKSDELSMPAAEFESSYEKKATHELIASAEGDVQMVAEQAVLDSLKAQIDSLQSALNQGEVLLIESEQGRDYPKLREKTSTIVVGNENRLYFERTIDPPLRLATYAPRKS